MNLLITLAGLALLIVGGEALVRGAVGIAQKAGISPFVVGLTIVGFGTSAPELVVSVDASLAGAPGIAVGNVIGSNLSNMMLIIGMAALICPLTIHPNAVRRDGAMMALATLLFVGFAFSGSLSRAVGAAFVLLLSLYLAFSFWSDKRQVNGAAALHRAEGNVAETSAFRPLWMLVSLIVVGLTALVGGSRIAVTGATALAIDAGISQEVIGITLVALGTSLPELATAIMAAKRGHADVCVGNVIGSNIFNLLGIAGAAALAAPLTFDLDIVRYDLWDLLAATGILIAFMLTGHRVARWEGAGLVLLYCIYIAHHFIPGGIFALLTGGA